ncbi:MAG: hypothetical protein LAP13_13980 [Acidobacteriia bacterium]|nr:hypothetical protein [Terriglobia bacterium]
MRADKEIEAAWFRLLATPARAGEAEIEKIEEGYYAVVLADPRDGNQPGETNDIQSLGARIPHLERTRAVYLSSEASYELEGIAPVRQWAGASAQELERGTRHAVAVVDLEVFARLVIWRLQGAGWDVAPSGQDLRVSEGHFTERLNLLRLIVRMVFSRCGMVEAARAARRELAERFALDAMLFARFAERYERFGPSIVDHYFTAYPESACMAAGWDYWQVAGRTTAEAERIFEQAMKEFETFLSKPSDEWLPARPAPAREPDGLEN